MTVGVEIGCMGLDIKLMLCEGNKNRKASDGQIKDVQVVQEGMAFASLLTSIAFYLTEPKPIDLR